MPQAKGKFRGSRLMPPTPIFDGIRLRWVLPARGFVKWRSGASGWFLGARCFWGLCDSLSPWGPWECGIMGMAKVGPVSPRFGGRRTYKLQRSTQCLLPSSPGPRPTPSPPGGVGVSCHITDIERQRSRWIVQGSTHSLGEPPQIR